MHLRYLLLLCCALLSSKLSGQSQLYFYEYYPSPYAETLKLPLGGVRVKLYSSDSLYRTTYADQRGIIDFGYGEQKSLQGRIYRLEVYHPRFGRCTVSNWLPTDGALQLHFPEDAHRIIRLRAKYDYLPLHIQQEAISDPLHYQFKQAGYAFVDTLTKGDLQLRLPEGNYQLQLRQPGDSLWQRLSFPLYDSEQADTLRLVQKEGKWRFKAVQAPPPPFPAVPPNVYLPPSSKAPEWTAQASSTQDCMPWYSGWGQRSLMQSALAAGETYLPPATVLIQDFIETPPPYPQNLDAPLALHAQWFEQAGESYLGIGLQTPPPPTPKTQLHLIAQSVGSYSSTSYFPDLREQLQGLPKSLVWEQEPDYGWWNAQLYRYSNSIWKDVASYFKQLPAKQEKVLYCWNSSSLLPPDSSEKATLKAAQVRLYSVQVGRSYTPFLQADTTRWKDWERPLYARDPRDLPPLLRFIERSKQPYLRELEVELEIRQGGRRLQRFSTTGVGGDDLPQDFPYEGYSLALWKFQATGEPLHIRLHLHYRDAAGKKQHYRWTQKWESPKKLPECHSHWRLLWALSAWIQQSQGAMAPVDWESIGLTLALERFFPFHVERWGE